MHGSATSQHPTPNFQFFQLFLSFSQKKTTTTLIFIFVVSSPGAASGLRVSVEAVDVGHDEKRES
jgi:hypothetical protein